MSNKTQNKIKRIDGESRYYEIDGIRYPSVTTILSCIDKPALRFWYRKEALLEVERNWEYLSEMIKGGTYLEDALKEVTKKSKTKPEEIMQKALDVGSAVHSCLEIMVKRQIQNNHKKIEWGKITQEELNALLPVSTPIENVKLIFNCLIAFGEWANKIDFRPVESELTVYSKKHQFAGTLDAIGLVKGKLAVIDFKSSKAIYSEMALQLSAYKFAYREMSKKAVPEMWILRLGKEDGEFEARKFNDYKNNIRAFMGAYELWSWKQKQEKK